MTDHDPNALPEGEEAPPKGVRTMAAIRWLLLGAMGVAALFSVGLWMAERTSSSAPISAEQHSQVEKPHAETYQCPMHPQVVSDKPGTCPICGMNLVRVEAKPDAPRDSAGPPGGTGVKVDAAQRQALGVRVEQVREEVLPRTLSLFGRVTADPAKVTQFHLRVSGYVEKLYVAEAGARVKVGEPLLALYSDELLRLQQELLQAKSWGGAATEPVRQRLRLLGISEQETAAMEARGEVQRNLVFRSPASGFVTAINVSRGERVDPERTLFEISDLSRVWVLADLYQSDVAGFREGIPAKLSLDAYPGQTFSGKVEYIYPTVNPETRSVPVRVVFSNKDGRLKPGMFGQLAIEPPASKGLFVSSEAVVDTGEHRYVYVETAPDRFVPREVTLGARADERVEVVSGLNAGDRVASSGNFFIDAESRLRASVASTPSEQRPAAAAPKDSEPDCDRDFDAKAAPDKYAQCKQCERVHRGMGSMEADCKRAIAKPWRAP